MILSTGVAALGALLAFTLIKSVKRPKPETVAQPERTAERTAEPVGV